MKNKTLGYLTLKSGSGAVFSSLLVVFAALFGSGERSAAAIFPPLAGDDSTFSMGVFRITVDPAFRPLMDTSAAPIAYTGYKLTDGKLTSPLCIDNATTIGRSSPHDRLLGGSTPVGAPSMGNLGYADYPAIPSLWSGAPAGTREILTQIRSFLLVSVTDRPDKHCPPDPRVPSVPLNWPMVKAGPDQGLTLKSIGMVQESVPNGAPNPDFPAQSFFDIFVEVNLPPLAGTRSAVAFPVTGAVLYNDSPLIITNLGLTTLPPTVVYIHGETTAVPLKFKFNNPPYWAAGNIFGYLVLAGHGTITDECTNTPAVNALLDAALGPIGTSAPEMPVEWLRPTNTCPSPGSAYESVKDIDIIRFPLPPGPLGTNIYARNFFHFNFPNPINPPPPGPPLTNNEPLTVVNLEVSPDGDNWSPAQAQGPLQVKIQRNPGTGSTATFQTEMLSLDLTGNSLFGPFMIRESPTRQSLGKHTIKQDPQGFRVSSFFDVDLELSLTGPGGPWYPANRSIRVQPDAPPAAPNSIFVSRDGPNVILDWLGDFALQSATDVTGPYNDVVPPVYTGPHPVSPTGQKMFFRLRGQ